MASSDSIAQARASHSARLSYNDFEIAIKAFQRQTKHYAPWSYVEYRPRRDQPLQGYLSMTHLIHSNKHSDPAEEVSSNSNLSTADQLLLDDLAEHFGEIPDEEAEDPAVPELALGVRAETNHSVYP
ncbi:hypothetical protein BGX21_002512 [Mortierella sp. AD011]|nr:hypothetical protein BGX20_006411 [Mortierella sp. AD010]KAF9379982.1 hypothetical protein BGX21_002512 [Mortierella sp. AD011]